MSQEWITIQIAEDAIPLVDQVVAYQTNMFIYGGSKHKFVQAWASAANQVTNNKTYFGYVEYKEAHSAYPYLVALLTPQSSDMEKALNVHTIKVQSTNKNNLGGSSRKLGFIQMRPATEAEIEECREAVRSGKAVIEASSSKFKSALTL